MSTFTPNKRVVFCFDKRPILPPTCGIGLLFGWHQMYFEAQVYCVLVSNGFWQRGSPACTHVTNLQFKGLNPLITEKDDSLQEAGLDAMSEKKFMTLFCLTAI